MDRQCLKAAQLTCPTIGQALGQMQAALRQIIAKGSLHSIYVTPSQADWLVTIIYTEYQGRNRYIRLDQLASALYYSAEYLRRRVSEFDIDLVRGPGRGRPLYIMETDARRIIDYLCPSLAVDIDSMAEDLQPEAESV